MRPSVVPCAVNMSPESPATRRSFYLEIFLISLAVLLLQISYTRILSFKFASYFTYLVIGLAMLGVGSGGVFVAVSSRLRNAGPEKLLPILGLAGGLVIVVGYGITASVETDLYRHATSLEQIARLALISVSVFSGFLLMGLVVAVVFAHRPGEISRLYFADLMGAGAGCAIAIPLMLLLTPPGCIFASAAAVSLIGVRTAGSLGGLLRFAPWVLALPLAVVAGFGHSLPRSGRRCHETSRTRGAEEGRSSALQRVESGLPRRCTRGPQSTVAASDRPRWPVDFSTLESK